MQEHALGHTWSRRNMASAPTTIRDGLVLKGSNIAPKQAHTASGHTYRTLFQEWDWDGWIRPQVDALASIGGNCVRLIGDMEGVNDGTFNVTDYVSRWRQLADYAQTKEMLIYPALGGVSQIAAAGLNLSQITSTLVDVATELDGFKDQIVGLDLIQESVRSIKSTSWALGSGGTISPAVRAVTSIPITYSYSDNADLGSRFGFPLWKSILRPFVDFFDIHVYAGAPRGMLFDAFWGQGVDIPVVIGEFGAPTGAGASVQYRIYDNVVRLATDRRLGKKLGGCLSWSIFDQGTGDLAYGMFENDGTPRVELVDRFAQLPIA